jgi:hypothetical protein
MSEGEMERRSEPRFEFDQDVILTLLGNAPVSVQARLANLSGRGALIRVPEPLPVGAPVRITWGDKLLLGEISHVEKGPDGYSAGIQLESSLTSLADLQRLMAAVMGRPRPAVESAEVASVKSVK